MSLTEEQYQYFDRKRNAANITLNEVSYPHSFFGIEIRIPRPSNEVKNYVYNYFATQWNSWCLAVIVPILANDEKPFFAPISFSIDLLAKAIYYIANCFESFINSSPIVGI